MRVSGCRLLLVQVTKRGIAVERGEDGLDFLPVKDLPPLCMPQELLPEGASFAGVGTLGDEDAYLYVLRGGNAARVRPVAEVLAGSAPGLHPALPHLAKWAIEAKAPLQFRIQKTDAGWEAEAHDLQEEISGNPLPRF